MRLVLSYITSKVLTLYDKVNNFNQTSLSTRRVGVKPFANRIFEIRISSRGSLNLWVERSSPCRVNNLHTLQPVGERWRAPTRTILILQNRTGQRAGPRPHGVTVPARGVSVVPSPASSAGSSDSITVSTDAPYGALVGKAVALDPAGLAFDTPLSERPR
jgi:hypothetical protein